MVVPFTKRVEWVHKRGLGWERKRNGDGGDHSTETSIRFRHVMIFSGI